MLQSQRVLHGTTDVSTLVNDYRAGEYTFAYVSGTYLYVASEVPISNLYVEVGTANDVAATVAVEHWDGTAWRSAVDVVDETRNAAGTIPLAQTGRISWTTHLDRGWNIADRSSDVTGLAADSAIYYKFWLRFSWSQTLKATTSLKYVGQRFSSDDELFASYPDLRNSQVMTAFATGKTDWKEQAYMAAEMIVSDLVHRRVIEARGQIVDWSRLTEPSVHKVAEIVYRGMGKGYAPERDAALESYRRAMGRDFFRVDKSKSGRVEPAEKRVSQLDLGR